MITSHQYRSDLLGGPCTYKWHLTPCGGYLDEHQEVDYKTKAELQNGRKRIALVVYVDLDPAPGAFHSKESAMNNVRGVLRRMIGHYNPLVSFAPDSLQPDHDSNELSVLLDTDNIKGNSEA